MKKKLFLLLLIIALAAFVFTGCTPPAEGEGEGEGEGEVEDVIIEFAGQYVDAGRTYVKGGNRKITVTFPEAVSGVVTADVSDCSGDYGKGTVGLFSADGIVWEGSVSFPCSTTYYDICEDTCETVPVGCCSSVVTINYEGKKEQVAVIVDCEKPEIGTVAICVEDCTCEGCKLSFTSGKISDCDSCDPEVYCKDCCSGFAGWTIALYEGKKNPFDECCETPCAEPADTGSGDCRIEWTSNKCFDGTVEGGKIVWAVITVTDNVGNTFKELAKIIVTESDSEEDRCSIKLEEIFHSCVDEPDFQCGKECGCEID